MGESAMAAHSRHNTPMRVVLVNQFFPPDFAPTGRLLVDLAVELVGRGHDVTVLCSAASYAEGGGGSGTMPAGLRVFRLGRQGSARRGLVRTFGRYAGFHARVWIALTRLYPRPDVVVAMSTPPLIGLTAQAAARNGIRHVQWMMDVYPGVLGAHGMLQPKGIAYRILSGLVRRQNLGSSLVVALSAGMARSTRTTAGDGAAPPVEVVPLWAPEGLAPWPDGESNPMRDARGWNATDTVFLYSGNMGLGHAVSPFLEAALAARESPGLRWVFAGAGRSCGDVDAYVRRHPGARVERLAYVDERDLRAHLCSADVHLVSLRSAWRDLIFPSKLPAAFAVGRPVIFVGHPGSELAELVRDGGAGWMVPEGDAAGLLKAVHECRDVAERKRRGDAALRLGHRLFSRAVNCGRLADLLESRVIPAGRT